MELNREHLDLLNSKFKEEHYPSRDKIIEDWKSAFCTDDISYGTVRALVLWDVIPDASTNSVFAFQMLQPKDDIFTAFFDIEEFDTSSFLENNLTLVKASPLVLDNGNTTFNIHLKGKKTDLLAWSSKHLNYDEELLNKRVFK